MEIPTNLPKEKLWKWINREALKQAEIRFKEWESKNAGLSTSKKGNINGSKKSI